MRKAEGVDNLASLLLILVFLDSILLRILGLIYVFKFDPKLFYDYTMIYVIVESKCHFDHEFLGYIINAINNSSQHVAWLSSESLN